MKTADRFAADNAADSPLDAFDVIGQHAPQGGHIITPLDRAALFCRGTRGAPRAVTGQSC